MMTDLSRGRVACTCLRSGQVQAPNGIDGKKNRYVNSGESTAGASRRETPAGQGCKPRFMALIDLRTPLARPAEPLLVGTGRFVKASLGLFLPDSSTIVFQGEHHVNDRYYAQLPMHPNRAGGLVAWA
jgi:hypothetical protein